MSEDEVSTFLFSFTRLYVQYTNRTLIGCYILLVYREPAYHHHVPWERREPRPQDPTRRHILQKDAVQCVDDVLQRVRGVVFLFPGSFSLYIRTGMVIQKDHHPKKVKILSKFHLIDGCF